MLDYLNPVLIFLLLFGYFNLIYFVQNFRLTIESNVFFYFHPFRFLLSPCIVIDPGKWPRCLLLERQTI